MIRIRILLMLAFWICAIQMPVNAATNDYDFSAFQKSVENVPQQTTTEQQTKDSGLTSDQVLAIVSQYMQQQADDSSAQIIKTRVNNEFWYIVLLCTVALVALFMVLVFLRGRGHSAKDVVNAAGLILIIFGTIILVLVVDTTEQLTAAIGVLGAIAGYLFGTIQADRKVSAEAQVQGQGNSG